MGKKKKKVVKPWCWYCERDFDSETILIEHQKAKHFKCNICNKRLYNVPGLKTHCLKVHKETLRNVPGAKPERDNIELEIFGMEGIPEEDLLAHDGSLPGGAGAAGSDGEELVPPFAGAFANASAQGVGMGPPMGMGMHLPPGMGMPPPPGMPPMGFPFRPPGPYGMPPMPPGMGPPHSMYPPPLPGSAGFRPGMPPPPHFPHQRMPPPPHQPGSFAPAPGMARPPGQNMGGAQQPQQPPFMRPPMPQQQSQMHWGGPPRPPPASLPGSSTPSNQPISFNITGMFEGASTSSNEGIKGESSDSSNNNIGNNQNTNNHQNNNNSYNSSNSNGQNNVNGSFSDSNSSNVGNEASSKNAFENSSLKAVTTGNTLDGIRGTNNSSTDSSSSLPGIFSPLMIPGEGLLVYPFEDESLEERRASLSRYRTPVKR